MNGPVIPPPSSPTNAKNKFRPSPPPACCSLHAEISLLLPPPPNPFPRHGGVGWSVVGWAGRTLSDFAPTDLLSANKRRGRRRRRRRAPLGKINMQRRTERRDRGGGGGRVRIFHRYFRSLNHRAEGEGNKKATRFAWTFSGVECGARAPPSEAGISNIGTLNVTAKHLLFTPPPFFFEIPFICLPFLTLLLSLLNKFYCPLLTATIHAVCRRAWGEMIRPAPKI